MVAWGRKRRYLKKKQTNNSNERTKSFEIIQNHGLLMYYKNLL